MKAPSAASSSESERDRAHGLSLDQPSGQVRKKLRVDGAEEALDLAASLRPADGRMNEFDP